jgi:large subunit ribosomal protein L11
MAFVRNVKLRVPACAARPGPAIGQALGPLGINMAEFCKQFNDKSETMGYERDTPLTVQLSAYADRTFQLDLRSPPTSYLIKKAAGVEAGPARPDPGTPHGFIAPEAVYEIARVKQRDGHRWHLPLEGVARSVVGTARSMGIWVKEAEDDQGQDGDGAAGGDGDGDQKKQKGKKGKKKKK